MAYVGVVASRQRSLLESIAGDERCIEGIVHGPKWILSMAFDAAEPRSGGLALPSVTCCSGEDTGVSGTRCSSPR